MNATLPMFLSSSNVSRILKLTILIVLLGKLSVYPQVSCPSCPDNLSFENGDFSNWIGTYGNYVFRLPTPINNPDTNYAPAGTGTPTPRYAITSGNGTDPNVPSLPVKAPSPCGGNYSARIGYPGIPESTGDGNYPYFEALTYKLRVTPQTAGFTYMYAAVLVNGNHDKFTQPQFEVIMKKASDGSYLPCGQYAIYAGNGSSEFIDAGNSIQYTKWTSVATDLSNYIGQDIYITFRVRDCMGFLSSLNGSYSSVGGGAHQGYAYIDAYCTPITQLTNPEFCAGTGNIQICAPPGYAGYNWPAGQPGITGSPTTQCVTVNNPVGGTTYTVNLTSVGGCPVTFKIPIQSIPTTNTKDTVRICKGLKDTLKIMATGNNGPYTYSWSHGLGSSTSVVVQPTVTTTYTVTITNANNCTDKRFFTVIVDPCDPNVVVNGGIICEGDSILLKAKVNKASPPYVFDWQPGGMTDSTVYVSPVTTTVYTVTVKDAIGNVFSDTTTVIVKPAPVISVNSATVCAGETAVFTANGASTYTWPPGFTVNNNTATIQPTASATYWLSGQKDGCKDTVKFNVVVKTTPTVAVNSTNICKGETTTLTASGSLFYTWLPVNTLPDSATVNVSPAITTTYTVIGSDSLGACPDTAYALVTVLNYPVITVNSPVICNGSKAQLTANGAPNYTWSPGITVTGSNTAEILTSNSGNYYVIGANANGKCPDTASFSVTVKPVPVLSINGGEICKGDTIKLEVTGAVDYTWSPNTNLNFSSDSVVYAAPDATILYTIIGNTNNCTDTITAQVKVLPVPELKVNLPEICKGDTALLVAAGADNYTWSTGLTVVGSDKATVAPAVTTEYQLTGAIGKCIDSIPVKVIVHPVPVAAFEGPVEGCAPVTATFINSSTDSAGYYWNFGDGTSSGFYNPVHVYTQPGVYDVSLVVQKGFCSDSLKKPGIIKVYKLPLAVLSVNEQVVYESDPTVIFYNSSVNADSCYLNFGDGSSLNGACYPPGIEHRYETLGDFCARLIVNTIHQCRDTTEVCVSIKPETTFYIPNAFTPTGDKDNEIFYSYGINILEFNMQIYDRWGERIYESNNMKEGWNGRYQNDPGKPLVQEGVYVYRVVYSDLMQRTKQLVGTVTVVR